MAAGASGKPGSDQVYGKDMGMKRRSVCTVLMVAAVTLMAGCGLFQGGGGYQTGDGWTSKIAGDYKGIIYSGQVEYPGTTTFAIDDKGILTGTYELDDKGTTVTGTLSGFREVGERKLACTWVDLNGTGDFTLTFTEDLSAFEGQWNDAGSENTSGWNGKK